MKSSYAPPPSAIGYIFCATVSQVLLKAAGLFAGAQASLWAGWAMNPYLWLAMCSFAIALVFWTKTLRTLPLATAYSWTALTYVLVPVFGALLWQERLAPQYFIGLGCIIAGVFITTRPTTTSKIA